MMHRVVFSIWMALFLLSGCAGWGRECRVTFHLFDASGEPAEAVIAGLKVGSDGEWRELGRNLPASEVRITGSTVVFGRFRGESILAHLRSTAGAGDDWFEVTPLSCPYEIDVSLEHPDRSIGDISSRALKGKIPEDEKSRARWVRLVPLFGGQEPRLYTGVVDGKGGFEVRGNFKSSYHLLLWGTGRVVLGCRGLSVPDGHVIEVEVGRAGAVAGCGGEGVEARQTAGLREGSGLAPAQSLAQHADDVVGDTAVLVAVQKRP